LVLRGVTKFQDAGDVTKLFIMELNKVQVNIIRLFRNWGERNRKEQTQGEEGWWEGGDLVT